MLQVQRRLGIGYVRCATHLRCASELVCNTTWRVFKVVLACYACHQNLAYLQDCFALLCTSPESGVTFNLFCLANRLHGLHQHASNRLLLHEAMLQTILMILLPVTAQTQAAAYDLSIITPYNPIPWRGTRRSLLGCREKLSLVSSMPSDYTGSIQKGYSEKIKTAKVQ